MNKGPIKLGQADVDETAAELQGSPLMGQKQLRLWIPRRRDAEGAFIIDPVTCAVEVHTVAPLMVDLVVIPPPEQAGGPVLVQ